MTRLQLSNGQWVDVKDTLKVRDKRHVSDYALKGVASDGKSINFDPYRHQIATAAVRILNWSVLDDREKPIVWPSGKSFDERVAAIEGLDEDTLDVISEAINAHFRPAAPEEEPAKNETGEVLAGATN